MDCFDLCESFKQYVTILLKKYFIKYLYRRLIEKGFIQRFFWKEFKKWIYYIKFLKGVFTGFLYRETFINLFL